ncbi:MAG: YtfJ family protein [Moritella sp.]|uniref:YtfJ family protein n=1 Tax=Moritella sp. TaxID=78556 RepID=UPI0029A0690B|nr:YtfJ family protein [Moritella sp.]MDX2321798.1 YtfJ family protein [Moritella sp.]
MKKLIAVVALSLTPFISFASSVVVGEHLPQINIADKGEVILAQGKFSYRDWSSDELKGRVMVVQHLAGRTASKELNDPLMEVIADANFSPEVYNTATIVNTDDAMWGTSGLVNSSLKDNKEEFPTAIFVIDASGNTLNQLALEEKSSAIFLIDKEGTVLFSKDGALTKDEITEVMGMINANI